jgi:hypothetical protein
MRLIVASLNDMTIKNPDKSRPNPTHPDKSRQIPTDPDKSRQIPTDPDKTRQIPTSPTDTQESRPERNKMAMLAACER